MPRSPRLLLPAAALACAALLPACSPRQGPRPDLLLLTIDTLRGDRWGCLGDPLARTPHLDRLARGGTLAFEGRAPVPVTLPSHVSMMTGLPPAVHGVRDNGIFRLPAGQGRTLAEVLRDEGWDTAAFVSAFPLTRRFGLERGFRHYDSFLGPQEVAAGGMRQRSARETVDRVVAWFEDRKAPPPEEEAPLFLWVHFFDPHADYEPPPPWRSLFPRDPYRGEIASVDRQVGRLLRALRERRALRPLRIVVAADHGEGLGQHGEATHGALVFTSTIRVPVLVRRPEYAPRLLAAPRSLERVAATVLELAGFDRGPNPGAAPPLAAPARPVHAETLYPHYNFGWCGLRAREERGWRLITGAGDRLYRIAEDPGETRDVAAEHPDVVASLKARLEEEWEARAREAFAVERRELSEAEVEALEALGYVAGGAGPAEPPESAFRAGPDPHTRMAYVDAVNRALTHLRRGDPERAVALLQRVVAEDPRNRFALQYLGRALEEAGRTAEARQAYRAALSLGRNPERVYLELARVERLLGDREAEREVLVQALAAHPRSAETLGRLAGVLEREGRLEEARELLEEVLGFRPRLARAWFQLAHVYESLGRAQEARRHWERVLELEREGPLAEAARAALGRSSPPEESTR